MRKVSFVFFAVVVSIAMISLIGCRPFGDDGDDGVGPVAASTATLKGSISLASVSTTLLAHISAQVTDGKSANYKNLSAKLFDTNNAAIGSAVSVDASGSYTFSNVLPGTNYHVEIYNTGSTLKFLMYLDSVTAGESSIVVTEKTTAIGLIIQAALKKGKTLKTTDVVSYSIELDAVEKAVKNAIVSATGTTDLDKDTSVDEAATKISSGATPTPSSYASANGIKGGQLYDKFWATETGYDQTSANLTQLNKYADFFRCKQCHGWDLQGKTGAYINRSAKTTRPNIADSLVSLKSLDEQTLFNKIKSSSSATRRKIASDLSTYNPSSNATIGDQMPDYSELLTDAQIWDLVKFLKSEAIDVTQLYDATSSGTYPTGSLKFSNLGKGGDASAGKTYFETNCSSCHGKDGTKFKVDGNSAYVGEHIRSKPYEDQHKVKFGQLGSAMTAFSTASLTNLKNLYAAMSDTIAFPTTVPASYSSADGIAGGQLYDKFWATETGYDQTSANLTQLNKYADFFRCKQCHGWDLQGKTGAYINRSAKTTRPNIADSLASMKSLDAQTLFDKIKSSSSATRRKIASDLSTYNPSTNATVGDQMPDYSELLTDAQIWNLVKFIKTEAVDVSQLYDMTTSGTYPTGTASFTNLGKGGDAAAGKTYFATNCASCHGTDGTKFKVDGNSAYVGEHIRTKAYEDQHKVKFGQLGSAMTAFSSVSMTDLKNLYSAMSDTTAFPANAPSTTTTTTTTTSTSTSTSTGTTDGAQLYASKCQSCHGALATSSKKGATATTIQSAITGNKGGMGSISLTTAEIAAIETALK